jgi:low affinity Fe/Cu permease
VHREKSRSDEDRWLRGIFHRRDRGLRTSGEWQSRSRPSRTLHRMGLLSAHAGAGLAAGGFVVAWTVVGVATGFPHWWETVLYSTSAAITLIMVFVLQHMQSRLESATQRKLDELLRALPNADERLIAVEEAADAELEALSDLNRADRAHLQEDGEVEADRGAGPATRSV